VRLVEANAATRRELIEAFVPQSPLVRHLGIELRALRPDEAELVLPFSESVVTIGDVVHGGAISALIDTAAMAAAWSDETIPESVGGSTVALSVDFVSAARSEEVVATARVVRRGQSLCFCEVTASGDDGRVVAKGLVTYRFG
jgi:uncharacterized protein (TIGR00369 family)